MLSPFQRRSIIAEIREIYTKNNDDIPPNTFIENLWQTMPTHKLYEALRNFRIMAEKFER
jgi:hypothetical protein